MNSKEKGRKGQPNKDLPQGIAANAEVVKATITRSEIIKKSVTVEAKGKVTIPSTGVLLDLGAGKAIEGVIDHKAKKLKIGDNVTGTSTTRLHNENGVIFLTTADEEAARRAIELERTEKRNKKEKEKAEVKNLGQRLVNLLSPFKETKETIDAKETRDIEAMLAEDERIANEAKKRIKVEVIAVPIVVKIAGKTPVVKSNKQKVIGAILGAVALGAILGLVPEEENNSKVIDTPTPNQAVGPMAPKPTQEITAAFQTGVPVPPGGEVGIGKAAIIRDINWNTNEVWISWSNSLSTPVKVGPINGNTLHVLDAWTTVGNGQWTSIAKDAWAEAQRDLQGSLGTTGMTVRLMQDDGTFVNVPSTDTPTPTPSRAAVTPALKPTQETTAVFQTEVPVPVPPGGEVGVGKAAIIREISWDTKEVWISWSNSLSAPVKVGPIDGNTQHVRDAWTNVGNGPWTSIAEEALTEAKRDLQGSLGITGMTVHFMQPDRTFGNVPSTIK